MRKIPTKQELLQLQRLYRTDKRIGLALGNVSGQLVAYWRRKKGIGKSVFPKYSLSEIKELWERFGDDSKAGQELGITKQAFYRWRKKYRLLERPTILRLEQLELRFFDEQRLNRVGDRELPAQTFLQKTVSFHCGNRLPHIGEQVALSIDLAVSFDAGGITVIPSARKHGGKADRSSAMNFDSFMSMFEAGFFRPGQVIVSDRAETAALAVTASYVKIVPELASALQSRSGEVIIDLVPTLRTVLPSASPVKRSAYDFACRIREAIKDYLDRKLIIELSGAGVEGLTLEDRMALLTYTTLLTGQQAVIAPDQTFLNYLHHYQKTDLPVPFSDKNSPFLDEVSVTVAKSRSPVFFLTSKSFVADAQEFSNRVLKRVRIGPLLGGTLEDFRLVAQILKSDALKKGVELYLIPSSTFVYSEALRRRYVHSIVEAGGKVGNTSSFPPLPRLLPHEYELTTELSCSSGDTYLTSIQTIVQAVRSGKVSKRVLDAL